MLIGALGHFISQSCRHEPVQSTFIVQSSNPSSFEPQASKEQAQWNAELDQKRADLEENHALIKELQARRTPRLS